LRKEERNMSKSKIVGMMALIAFAMSILFVGNAVAGEKFKIRGVYYATKWETINVPGEEKHLLALSDSRGVTSNLEGKPFGDGLVVQSAGWLDIDIKTELGSGNFYEEWTDRDGDKICIKSEGKRMKGQIWGSSWEGTATMVKGTGKYEGIQGRCKWSYYNPAKMQTVVNSEWEVELSRR
jgi:hypothetical protein